MTVVALQTQGETSRTDCQAWTGRIDSKGYGRTGSGREAHVVAYEQTYGPVPRGLHLDHTCHNVDPACPGGVCPHRRCVNPTHLEAVPPRVNVLRGKGVTAINAAKTECVHGHAFTPENTYVRIRDGGPRRECRICRRRHRADAKRRNRSAHSSAGIAAPTGERSPSVPPVDPPSPGGTDR